MSRFSRDDLPGRDDFSGRNNEKGNPDLGKDFFGNDFSGGDFPTEGDFERDLLGYVLGALDERETRQIDQLIQDHPDLEDELQLIRMSIAPLEQLKTELNPPAGLARRACESVATFRSAHETKQHPVSSTLRSTAQMSPAISNYELYQPSVSRRDMIAIALSIVALAAVALPILNHNRFYSRVIQCQDNLRKTGMALFQYADANRNRFIEIPSQGNLAIAGSYAPTLLDQGYVEDDGIFYCSARRVEDNQSRTIPSLDQLRNASGTKLIEFQRGSGGDFGYTIGHFDKGRYASPSRQGRSNFVVLADQPSFDLPGRSSSNHGGYGQNCFFDDGHTALVNVNSVAGDAIYENDMGQIAPGAHELDSVIAPSQTRLNRSTGSF